MDLMGLQIQCAKNHTKKNHLGLMKFKTLVKGERRGVILIRVQHYSSISSHFMKELSHVSVASQFFFLANWLDVFCKVLFFPHVFFFLLPWCFPRCPILKTRKIRKLLAPLDTLEPCSMKSVMSSTLGLPVLPWHSPKSPRPPKTNNWQKALPLPYILWMVQKSG